MPAACFQFILGSLVLVVTGRISRECSAIGRVRLFNQVQRTDFRYAYRRVDDMPGRRTLRSTNANLLVVPPVKLSIVGSRAFAVAAPHIWNTLPTDFVAANSRFLFKQSYPDYHLLTSSS